MRVLVTGGAGYIGSVLVPLLLENGFRVRVLDNLMYNGVGLLPHFRNPSFEFHRGDIRDKQTVRDALAGSDIVIHLAAIVGFPACRKEPEVAESVNVGGTKTIAAELGRTRLLLYGSTGSNYGALVDDVCTEETPLNPLSIYGKTKTAAERHLMENCNTIAFRFATGFGLSSRLRLDLLINDFVYTALKQRYLVIYESQFMRTFIHVYDIARSYLFGIENSSKMQGQIYNVGGDRMNYSKRQVCELIRQKLEFYLHYAEVGEDADKRNYVVSYNKIAALGYKTTITVEQGIDEVIRGLAAIDVRIPFSNV
jgi:nucleoside-diphosphate-sugar epimerase